MVTNDRSSTLNDHPQFTCTMIDVDGMMCQKNCGSTVQRALLSVPGVETAEVSFLDKRAIIWGTASTPSLLNAIENVGFGACLSPDVILDIEGMMCQNNCGSTVNKAIAKVPGVAKVVVTFADANARIWGTASVSELIDAVEIVGFGAELHPDVILYIDGMMCQKNCGNTVQSALSSVPGVSKAIVSFADKQAKIWGTASHEDLIEAVISIGFDAERWNPLKHNDVLPSPPPTKPANVVPFSTVISPALGCSLGVFSVSGMTCASCVGKVERHLLSQPGVVNVRVALLAEKAEVDFNSAEITETMISRSICSLGYPTTHIRTIQPDSIHNTREVSISVPALTMFPDSAMQIETALLSMQGVVSIILSTASGIARVTINTKSEEGCVGVRDMLDCLETLGYHATAIKPDSGISQMGRSQARESNGWWRRFLISACLTIPLMALHMFQAQIGAWAMTSVACNGKLTVDICIRWMLATIIQFGVGQRFYINAWRGLKHGNMGMDMLVVVGTSASYVYSVVALIIGCAIAIFEPHIFLEAGSMLITFITLGKWLESMAKGKTSEALSLLMRLQPNKAMLVMDDGMEKEIDIYLVQTGDALRVLPGANVPTDGVVISGTSFIDESMITGEPLAVLRKEGDKVIGGTINQNGMIIMEAHQIGGDTLVSQIVELVEKAQMSKAPIQEYADKIAGLFTPTVLLLALLTFVVWFVVAEIDGENWMPEGDDDPFLFALLFSISVVVISCPCALGLATPTAVMVGTGVGAANGVLIKGGAALERSHEITTIIFDKTGTLTTGKPVLTDEVPFGIARTWTAHSVLRLAAACEKCSEHPVGQTVIRAAVNAGMTLPDVSDFEIATGLGVACSYKGSKIYVGNRNWMVANRIKIEASVEDVLYSFEEQGKTAIIVGLGREVIGVLAVADQLKKEAKSTVLALQKMNLKVWMVTGDNSRTALFLAHELGIPDDRVIAEVLPANKAQKVKELQELGEVVGMVGDGINDSPALASADVGIAVGAGTQVAIEAAQMVLVRNNLHDVVVALHLSRCVFRRIRINFLWAMIYNIFGIPFAAGALYPIFHMRLPPSFAGLSMTLSSVSVVLSSLGLRFYRRPEITPDGQLRQSSALGACLNWFGTNAARKVELATPRVLKSNSFKIRSLSRRKSVFGTGLTYTKLLPEDSGSAWGIDGENEGIELQMQGHFL